MSVCLFLGSHISNASTVRSVWRFNLTLLIGCSEVFGRLDVLLSCRINGYNNNNNNNNNNNSFIYIAIYTESSISLNSHKLKLYKRKNLKCIKR